MCELFCSTFPPTLKSLLQSTGHSRIPTGALHHISHSWTVPATSFRLDEPPTMTYSVNSRGSPAKEHMQISDDNGINSDKGRIFLKVKCKTPCLTARRVGGNRLQTKMDARRTNEAGQGRLRSSVVSPRQPAPCNGVQSKKVAGG